MVEAWALPDGPAALLEACGVDGGMASTQVNETAPGPGPAQAFPLKDMLPASGGTLGLKLSLTDIVMAEALATPPKISSNA